jgi:hypothetical protein
VGTWGNLAVDDAALHVDPAAPVGGDGTQGAPLTELTTALAQRADGQAVYLAEGTHQGPISADETVQELIVRGRCADLVRVLDGHTPWSAVYLTMAAEGRASLSGLSIGGREGGVWIRGGQLELTDSEIVGSGLVGLAALGYTTIDVDMERVVIRDIEPLDGARGEGIYVWGDTDLDAVDVEVDAVQETGIWVHDGARANLSRVSIGDVRPTDGVSSGLWVSIGGWARCEDCTAVPTPNGGVHVEGEAELVRTRVGGTSPSASGEATAGVVAVGGGRIVAEDLVAVEGTGPGGSALYVGTDSTVACTGCSLDDSAGVGATVSGEGATADLTGSTVVGAGMDANGIWVGDGAHLTVQDVRVQDVVGTGLIVADGARVTAQDLVVQDITGDGVAVIRDSTLTWEGGKIDGILAGVEDAESLTGVTVTDDCAATIADVEMSNIAGIGALAAGPGASLALDGVAIRDGTAVDGLDAGGILALRGGQVDAQAVQVLDVAGWGLFAGYDGARIAAAEVVVAGVTPAVRFLLPAGTEDQLGVALGAGDGGTVAVSDVVIRDAAGVALFINPGGALTGSDLQIADTGPSELRDVSVDVIVMADGAAALDRLTLDGPVAHGLAVGGAVQVTELALAPSLGLGATVEAGGSLEVGGGVILGRAITALGARGEDARIQASNISIEDVHNSPTAALSNAAVAMDGARITLEDVEITGTDGPGLTSIDGGVVECTGCDIQDSTAVAVATQDGTLVLRDSVIDSVEPVAHYGGVGVLAQGEAGTVLTLEDTLVTGAPTAGVWLDGTGVFTLSDTEVHGGPRWSLGSLDVHGDAVFAGLGVGTGDGSLYIEGSTLAFAEGAGLFLHGATATLVDATFSDNAVDVIQQACSGALPSVTGLDQAPTSSICPEGEEAVLTMDYHPFVELGAITSE